MKRLVIALMAAVALAANTAAEAADLPIAPEAAIVAEAKQWQIAIAAYVWGAGISGETGVGGLPPVNVGFSFGDILQNLDFSAFTAGQVRYKRLVAFTDLQYTKITVEEPTPFQLLATSAKLRSETLSFLFTGGVQVIDTPRYSVDALAGGRLYWVANRVSVRGGLLGETSGELSEAWVDPVVGLQGRAQLTPAFHLLGWGFVGGFGISSDINWDVLGAVGWSPVPNASLLVGYRASGVDYSTDDFLYDTVTQGPVIGGVIRF